MDPSSSEPGTAALDSPHDAERAEYEALVAAGIFPKLSNSARLLEYVCRKYFEGSNVTEYSIAREALNRRSDFSPKQDSIVRVEAHRVRRRLHEYYVQEGADHALRLTIPTGSYLPVFLPSPLGKRNLPAQETPSPAPAQRPRPPRRLIVWAAATILLSIPLVATLYILGPRHRSRVPESAGRTDRAAAVLPGSFGPQSEVRISAGNKEGASYTDRLGHVWLPDRYFTGGQEQIAPYREIFRTEDPQLFLSLRQGHDFSYDVPLHAGLYQLRLYFAETLYGADNQEGGGESSRMFDVAANGVPLLTDFDPLSDAGGSNTADVRVFDRISPATDGKLHLTFHTKYPLKGTALVNGIEITPGSPDGFTPLRWVASTTAHVDPQNRVWVPDQFCYSGRLRTYRDSVANTPDPELYRSDRYGNFSYAIPVPDGTYKLTLYFAERWFGLANQGGPGPGSRLFNVYCNGVQLLSNLDISKEAGGSRKALVKEFHGLRPNAQGKLLVSFVPVKDYACLSALEVEQDSHRARRLPSEQR